MADEDYLRRGIAAARSGDFATAKGLLAQAVKANPRSEEAWLVLGYCLSDPQQREYCFRKVLDLNPNNLTALRFLWESKAPGADAPAWRQVERMLAKSRPAEVRQTAAAASAAEPGGLTEGGEQAEGDGRREEETPAAGRPMESPAGVVQGGRRGLGAGLVGFLLGLVLVGLPLLYWASSSQPPAPLNQVALAFVSRSGGGLDAGMVTGGPTLPPAWTATVQVTPSATPSPTVTPTPGFDQRLKDATADILAVRQDMEDGKYAEAILSWDKVIARLPEYADGYYQRGISYYQLTNNQRSLEEASRVANSALDDLTKAIELDPTVGDYYFTRYQVENYLQILEEFWPERQALLELMLEDLLQANALGNSHEWSERYTGFVLLSLGRCQEAVDYFNQLIEMAGPEAPPSAGLNEGLARAYYCLGDFNRALRHIDSAMELDSSEGLIWRRFHILHALGRRAEAFEIVDGSIQEVPYYRGWRYYLRALLYYERGEPELAEEDIYTGSSQTWGQYGVRAYVLGRLALDEGDEGGALEWLQLAQASFSPYYWQHTPLLKTINQLVQQLGVEPLYPTPTPDPSLPTPTPLPPVAELLLATPTPVVPADASEEDTGYPPQGVSIPPHEEAVYEGTGLVYFLPGDYPVYLFQSEEGVRISRVKSLIVKLDGGTPGEDTTLQAMFLGADLIGWGGAITLRWGENRIDNASHYVSENGDFYMGVSNYGSETIVVENISLRLSVVLEDGTSVVLGFDQ